MSLQEGSTRMDITQHQLERTDLVGHGGLVEWFAKRSREEVVAMP